MDVLLMGIDSSCARCWYHRLETGNIKRKKDGAMKAPLLQCAHFNPAVVSDQTELVGLKVVLSI